MLRRADSDTRQNVHARRNSRISAQVARGSDAEQNPCNPWLRTSNTGTIPKNMPTNFQLKRLKLKLDIVEKPENRVHKLTDKILTRRFRSPVAVKTNKSKLTGHLHYQANLTISIKSENHDSCHALPYDVGPARPGFLGEASRVKLI